MSSTAGSQGTNPLPTTSSAAAQSTANSRLSPTLDVSTFKALQDGSQRELLDLPDQTANAKYNGGGAMTLGLAGLGSGSNVVVLEEQIKGKWTSEVSRAKAEHLLSMVPTGVATGKSEGSGKEKEKEKEKVKDKGKQKEEKTIHNSKIKSKNASSSTPSLSEDSSDTKSSTTKTRKTRAGDSELHGVTGLGNMGNTCYMNSALQCVRSVEELTRYFLRDEYKGDLNPGNPLSHDGEVAKAYADLLHQMFDKKNPSFYPRYFKSVIGRYGPLFSGYGQQDSQEFVMFLLDGLQEDLNRILKKPYIEKPDSTDEMVDNFDALKKFSDENWNIYKARNDSVITDLFAGMYKSTVHCPDCGKVSIIFDPFHNLTLQIPVESLWSQKVAFFPLSGPPVVIDVEIDKTASVKSLKEYVGKKVGVDDVHRLMMAEIYKSKFYKTFENAVSLDESGITAQDHIAFYELEDIPTNYDADRRISHYRHHFSSRVDDDDDDDLFKGPKGDKMLIPVYHRLVQSRSPITAVPGFILCERQEAHNYEAILRKVLRQVNNITDKNLFADDDASSNDDSSELVDVNMSDGNVTAESVQSEDGLVDVSMRDRTPSRSEQDQSQKPKSSTKQQKDNKKLPRALKSGGFIPPDLQNIFEMKYYRSGESLSTTFSDERKRLPLLSTRSKPVKRNELDISNGAGSDSSDNDEFSSRSVFNGVDRQRDAASVRGNNDDDDDDNDGDGDGDGDHSMLGHNGEATDDSDSSGSDIDPITEEPKPQNETKQKPVGQPLIRPDETLIIDWNEEAYEATFGSHNSLASWEHMEDIHDPELQRRRLIRQKKARNGVALSDCLDEFHREEVLSENDAWYCPRCKEHRRATKKFELWKLPDILVMHFKRFRSSRAFRDKIDCLIDFPLELDMSDRVVCPPEDGKSMEYELFAVDNHYGGLGGGHYTAFARNFTDGCWYEYNDSHASKVSQPSQVCTRAAYLLFYRRKSDKPLGGPRLQQILAEQSSENEDVDMEDEGGEEEHSTSAQLHSPKEASQDEKKNTLDSKQEQSPPSSPSSTKCTTNNDEFTITSPPEDDDDDDDDGGISVQELQA